MNIEAQAFLDKVVKKEINALTPHDIAFLKARESYLTDEQKKYFRKVLDAPLKPVKHFPDPNHIPYKELQRKAKALGLRYVGVKREDLIVDISTKEGPAYFKK